MKQVLVHSGGGANGAWGLGVMKYLVEEKGCDWNILFGTSVGALNGAGFTMYSTGHAKEALENLLKIWAAVLPDKIYKHWWPGGTVGDIRGLLSKTGLYDTNPLHKFVNQCYDQEKIAASDRYLSVAAVNLDSGELEFFDDQHLDIKAAVMASSSYPLFFIPVKINGHWYSDGGLVEIVPMRRAVEKAFALYGKDEEILVDVIICQPIKDGPWSGEGKTTLEIAPRMLGCMTTEIANNDVDEGVEYAAQHPNMTVRLWQPDKNVGSGLDFTQAKVQKLIQAGYDYAKAKDIES